MSDTWQLIVKHPLKHLSSSTQHLSSDTKRLSSMYQASVKQAPTMHLSSNHQASSKYQAAIKHLYLLDRCLMVAWYLLDRCLVVSWQMLDRYLLELDRCFLHAWQMLYIAWHMLCAAWWDAWQAVVNYLTCSTKHLSSAWRKRWCRSTNVCPLFMLADFTVQNQNVSIDRVQTFFAVTIADFPSPKIANISSVWNAVLCQNTNIYSSKHNFMTKIGYHSYLLMCKAIFLYFNNKVIANHKKYWKVSLFCDGYT